MRTRLTCSMLGDFEGQVNVPATVEDPAVIGVARKMVKEYFEAGGVSQLTKAKL